MTPRGPRRRTDLGNHAIMGLVADFLAAVGGSARTHKLRQHFTKRELSQAVASGDIVRSVRGVYALPGHDGAERRALELSAVLYLRSAAQAHGLGVLHRPPAVELAIARERRTPKVAGVVAVRRLLPPEDLVHQGEMRATSVVRTVLDCAAALPFAEGLAIADSALRSRLVTRDELHVSANAWVGRNRRAQQRVLQHMDGRAANAFESGLRAACIEGGVFMEPQVVIRTSGGDHRVDLAKTIPTVQGMRYLITEADSFEWHGGRDALHRDCTRYNELVRSDCIVLRFSWEHVMYERRWISEVVADVDRGPARRNSGLKRQASLPLSA